MAESTASSVTKNRIKTNYHGALEGFASYYFDVFPTETGPTSPTGEDDIRLKCKIITSCSLLNFIWTF